jgi:hypothetical protein
MSFIKSPKTPMAVTAAPAPGPCTTNGRGLYLSVWIIMILSEPLRAVTNGCVRGYLKTRQAGLNQTGPSDDTTYFSNPALTIPLWQSMTPTNRRTVPSLLEASLIFPNSTSEAGSRLRNSSPVRIFSNEGGTRDVV